MNAKNLAMTGFLRILFYMVGTMFASIFTAIPPFQQILFSKNEQAVFIKVIMFIFLQLIHKNKTPI